MPAKFSPNCTPSTAASSLREDQVSYDVFDYNTSDYLDGEQYKWYLVRTDTFDGIQTVEGTVNSLRFETVKDYDDWLGRMRNFPAYMDQNIGLMREGIKHRILLPKVIGEKVLTQLNGMDWQDPTRHGFYKPFKNMPPSFSDADRQRLTAAAQQTIKATCCPHFNASATSCRKTIFPPRLNRSAPGRFRTAMQPTRIWPDRRTTTKLTPEQIHEIGFRK